MANTLQGIKQRFGIIGRSTLLERAISTAQRVAATDLSVLIHGESGVGKEVFSHIIHELSPRKHNKFIAINCGAIPGGTINSELFGHEKGAFTGAHEARKGYFETVNQGTIFLDEIGEMPLDTQAYLLRVLETGEYIKVGSSIMLKTDLRIIAATNVDLRDKIQKGKFREDLYYRLNTVPIKIPALRERPEDIYMLFRKFAVDFSEKYRTDSIKLTDDARSAIENYKWQGNVRELRNIVEQLSVLSEDKEIGLAELVSVIPTLLDRNLPATIKSKGEQVSFEERELLYKFLFDMKNDLNDLKSLVFEMIQSNDLNVSDYSNYRKAGKTDNFDSRLEDLMSKNQKEMVPVPIKDSTSDNLSTDFQKPIILQKSQYDNQFLKTEEVIENLSLEDMEKEFIQKALQKYKGRRKEAAEELGISERTLYRKINQYQIEA